MSAAETEDGAPLRPLRRIDGTRLWAAQAETWRQRIAVGEYGNRTNSAGRPTHDHQRKW
jgi:hypothetical protein